MSASWMLACTIVALLLGVSATALERVASLYRRMPLRWIWGAATATTLVFAVAWLLPRRTSGPANSPAGAGMPGLGVVVAGGAPLRSAGGLTPAERVAKNGAGTGAGLRLPAIAPEIERPLFIGWAVCSAMLALALAWSAWRLRLERKRWTVDLVGGTSVLVSPTFGPAIVGVLRPAIVVPR